MKKESISHMALQMLAKKELKDNKLKEVGIYVNYVNPIIFKDKKIWAIKNRIYQRDNKHETFSDFCIFILLEKLGPEWLNEIKYKKEELNFLEKAFTEVIKLKGSAIFNGVKVREGVYSTNPNGYIKSIYSLAFDIFTLDHVSNIPDKLIQRLKNTNEYQGVRYEIMIAAVIARLGFNITWIDNSTAKHCEFIAEHQVSGTKIGVEAKSRHRKGVLNQLGILDMYKSKKGDIQGLLTSALEKEECGLMPYIIFIDINSPLENKSRMEDVPWVKDIIKNAKRKNKIISVNNKSDYNFIFFTNHSYHYDQEKNAGGNEILSQAPQFVKFVLPDDSLHEGIQNALKWYGNIPDIDLNI